MQTTESLAEAALRTLRDPRGDDEAYPDAFMRHLNDLTGEWATPTDSTVDGLAYAMLRTDVPESERALLAFSALTEGRDSLIGAASMAGVWGWDMKAVTDAASDKTNTLVSGVVEFAASYPVRVEGNNFQRNMMEVLNPRKESPEDGAVSAIVGSNLLLPYIANRLVSIDPYNKEDVARAAQEIRRDIDLFRNFYGPTSHVIEFLLEGESSKTHEQIAEEIFKIGPLFTKLGQALTGAAEAVAPERTEFIQGIGRALQEGIALPDDSQTDAVARNLPEGLTLDSVISSASIAYVVDAVNKEGKHLAVKVKRPDIDQAIIDNVRVYTLVMDVVTSFIEAHTDEGLLSEKMQLIKGALPFMLHVLETDIRSELHFGKEVTAQNSAIRTFENHPGINVPTIMDEYSDRDHIAMDIAPGERIESLPGNPELLKNMMVFGLRSWKDKFVHGDMHGGNIKGLEDGTLIAYDWGKHIAVDPGFVRNIAMFALATSRKKPGAIAKSYTKVQSADHAQASRKQVEEVVHDILNSAEENGVAEDKLIQTLLMTMGIRHQSTIDANYVTLMKSAGAFAALFKNEISKPEYGGTLRKFFKVTKSAVAAVAEVYF